MRLIAILLLSIALATAGCLGGDDESNDGDGGGTMPTPTTPTPTPTTPTDGGGNGDGNETDESNGDGGTPTKQLPPVEVYNQTHEFAGGDVTGEAPVDETATVPEGYSQVVMNVTWIASETPTLNAELKVTLLDPADTVVGECELPAGAQSGSAQDCNVQGAATAGDYTIRYTGSGTTQAHVTLVAM